MSYVPVPFPVSYILHSCPRSPGLAPRQGSDPLPGPPNPRSTGLWWPHVPSSSAPVTWPGLWTSASAAPPPRDSCRRLSATPLKPGGLGCGAWGWGGSGHTRGCQRLGRPFRLTRLQGDQLNTAQIRGKMLAWPWGSSLLAHTHPAPTTPSTHPPSTQHPHHPPTQHPRHGHQEFWPKWLSEAPTARAISGCEIRSRH